MDDGGLPTSEAAAARYRLHRNDPDDAGYRSYLEAFIERAVAPFVRAGSRILDFGSGPRPVLARMMEERGWPVALYDPHFAPDARSLRGPFRLAVVHEVLEHVPRPYATLVRLRRRLAVRGLIAIRTRWAPQDPAGFARWWYREDPTHVSFFAPSCFRALAARLGCGIPLLAEPDLAVLRLR